jgi:hypothetical protein
MIKKMTDQDQIPFKQERDFGEVFNATFSFIQQEYKKLGVAMLYFVLPALLLASILMVLVNIEQQKMIEGISGGDPTLLDSNAPLFGNLFWYYGFIMLCYVFAFTVEKCTVYGYIKLYIEKGKNNFSINDVWGEIKKYFFPVLGTSIVVALITIIGFMLCFIPGIYLGVSLSLIYTALIFERKGFGNAFSRSFQLTGKKWWLTFGLVIITYLMIIIISMIFSVPGMLLGLKPLLTNMGSPGQIDTISFSTGYYILNSLTLLLTYFLYVIPPFIMAFHYFSLVEHVDKPSLEDRIGQIGKDA